MSISLDFAPHVDPIWLWVLTGVAVLLVGYAFWMRARGAWARGLAFAVLLAALANPLLVREVRQGLPDVVALVVDHSQSMSVGNRTGQADAAEANIKKQLSAMKDVQVREASVTTTTSGEDNGTRAFAALNTALADVPPDRVAGAIMITDGQVHDAPSANQVKAPLQALIAGDPKERDRKLTVVNAARFAIVGQWADIVVRVEDFGGSSGGMADLSLYIDGKVVATPQVEIGKNVTLRVPAVHEGENVVEVQVQPGPNELTLQNNRAVVTVSGVRDRLRVLLISGEPNAGERVWRNLLKADPSVDLVHFTILRPPDKPAFAINEMALIEFPTRELFQEKLNSFDLVIFDRYRERGILPFAYFENIAAYVENGGALLLSSGPEFAQDQSVYLTPLASVLPAQPSGEVVAQGFKPKVTDAGFAHPVTRGLTGANTPAGAEPSWGRWFRLIGTKTVSGETVMSGPGDKPLLVLDSVGKGRVAELMSDQIWLWARGFEGGGPQAELLRRLAHWLMKEPELEEERLSASVAGGVLHIERRSMSKEAAPISLTTPSGKQQTVALEKAEPGIWRSDVKISELGLYRMTDGKLSAVAAAGPLNPKEVADMRATAEVLAPLADASKGSVHWLKDGVPEIRRVAPGDTAGGSGWIGLKRNGAYRVTSVEQQPLLPAWLALTLLLGTLLLAWRAEGR